MIEVPLQTVDNFMSQFHVGHILLGALILAILGSLPLNSMKVLGLNVIAFGAIFLLAPISLTGDTVFFRMLGLGLLIVGPMLYIAER